MNSQARPVHSNQTGPHEDLAKVVQRHLTSQFQKPIQVHNQAAFAEMDKQVQAWQGPLILDSCCGVGESTAVIAERNPDALVIGVDKSAHRLQKHGSYETTQQGNRYYLVRADLMDFWRLAEQAMWPVQKHFILYPNPWPKAAHLSRRWHGSPVWPAVVKLGGQLTLRSNWSTYLLEVAEALSLSDFSAAITHLPATSTEPMTPFERKYQQSGQSLWQLQANLTCPRS
ncbi:tRNA (guanine-N(7)-)-methyltransferase [Idiomarina seosinensis]|uniref:tRNA (guanine(46)-N(7))-methyltransferase TrmB n=1 Tax=Idiomarina seosinensis TaxID=281739 RepID=UPI00384A61AA